MTEKDVLLIFSNIYWVTGVSAILAPAINGTTRVISSRGFHPKDFLEIVEKYKVTLTTTPPAHLALLVASEEIKNYDLSSLKVYTAAGAVIPYILKKQVHLYMPQCKIAAIYGMSEIGGAATVGFLNKEGSNGPLVPGVEAKIVNSSGEALEPGKTGEVWLRTPFKWLGYFKNPEATKQIYDEDRWIHSGDLGYFSEDGELFIVDRMKEILKSYGFHFSPSEIEKVIREIPGVNEVSVCGIEDIIAVHLPAAAIVKAVDSKLTEKEVSDYVASHLEKYKHLGGGVYFMENLPKTPSGKILKRKVLEICTKLRSQKLENS